MTNRLPRFDKEALQDLQATVSPKLRLAARRVIRQVGLFIVARLPTGARDDRPFKERLKSMGVIMFEEAAAQFERLRGARGGLARGWRNVVREVRARMGGLGRGGF